MDRVWSYAGRGGRGARRGSSPWNCYTINVLNQGSGPDSNIRVTVALPPELQFVKASDASNVQAEGQNLTFGVIPTLPAGKSATWTVEVKALKHGDVRFAVQLNADSLTEPADETEPTRVIE